MDIICGLVYESMNFGVIMFIFLGCDFVLFLILMLFVLVIFWIILISDFFLVVVRGFEVNVMKMSFGVFWFSFSVWSLLVCFLNLFRIFVICFVLIISLYFLNKVYC